MKLNFSGSVHYANGDPVSNVVVRIFDQDASGKLDDDLTISPALSDEYGHFSLVYEPMRYLDYLTIHAPIHPVSPSTRLVQGCMYQIWEMCIFPILNSIIPLMVFFTITTHRWAFLKRNSICLKIPPCNSSLLCTVLSLLITSQDISCPFPCLTS
jgi:hypothetical protein